MDEFINYRNRFSSFNLLYANCEVGHQSARISIETRINASGEELFFTKINQVEYIAGSIFELMRKIPSIKSIRIYRNVSALWKEDLTSIELIEAFRLSQALEEETSISYQLYVSIENEKYSTGICETLTDAIWELQEILSPISQFWLCTCFHCFFAHHPLDYMNTDRLYWCYRDVPEAMSEINAKGKAASPASWFAGTYYVNAFHTCAGWRRIQGEGNLNKG